MTTHVFVGPSLAGTPVPALPGEAVVHGPAGNGDLLALGLGAGDVVLLIDGFFQQRAPVRHKEILDVLAAGARVVGAASMGALRAAELDAYGMEGVGEVYAAFKADAFLGDDEVALLHAEADDGYRALTVPMVDVRWFASSAADPTVAAALLAAGQGLDYPQRSTAALQRAAGAVADPGLVALALAGESRKRLDALAGFAHVATTPAPAPPGDWARSPRWRTTYLEHWRAAATGVGGVSYRLALECRRVYDDAFPDRWRSVVEERLGNGAGLDLTSAEPHWLTPAERSTLGAAERGRLVRVRAGALDVDALLGDAVLRDRLLQPDPELWERCERALAVNAATELLGPRRRVEDLKPELVTRQLARVWRCGSEVELLARARDRGFPDLETANAASRLFLLSE